jgi:hypothetical protein
VQRMGVNRALIPSHGGNSQVGQSRR